MKNVTKILIVVGLLAIITTGIIFGFFLGRFTKLKEKPQSKPTSTASQTTSPSATATATHEVFENFIGYVIADIGLNLRNKPAATGQVVLVIPYAASVLVDGEAGDFYHGSYQDTVGYFAKQYISRENPIASWKTYKSNAYSFSVKYPANWTITKDNYITEPAKYLEVAFGEHLSLYVDAPMGFEGVTTVSEESKNFDGIVGKKSIFKDETGKRTIFASVQKGSSTYFIMAAEKNNISRIVDLMIENWKWK